MKQDIEKPQTKNVFSKLHICVITFSLQNPVLGDLVQVTKNDWCLIFFSFVWSIFDEFWRLCLTYGTIEMFNVKCISASILFFSDKNLLINIPFQNIIAPMIYKSSKIGLNVSLLWKMFMHVQLHQCQICFFFPIKRGSWCFYLQWKYCVCKKFVDQVVNFISLLIRPVRNKIYSISKQLLSALKTLVMW